MTNIKQVDREAAETIDCLEWLSCDNRYNPQLLTILATHREQAVEKSEAKMRSIVAHSTGGNLQEASGGLNDICCEISRARNQVYAAGKDAGRQESEQAVSELVDALERIAMSADDLSSEWASNAISKYRNHE